MTSAHELLNNKWLMADGSTSKASKTTKRKSQQTSEVDADDNAVLLSLKELLNVSSDWKEVNNLKG